MKYPLLLRPCWLQLTVYVLAVVGLVSVLASRLFGFDAETQMFMLPATGWLMMPTALVLHCALRENRRFLPWIAGFLATVCLLLLVNLDRSTERQLSLAVPVLCCAVAYGLARQTNVLSKAISLLLGAGVMLLAALAQFSYGLIDLPVLSLAQKIPAATMTNSIVFLMGLAAVLLATASESSELRPNRLVAIAGLTGACATTAAWVLMSWQVTQAYDNQSALLLSRTEVAIQRSMESRLTLLGRMASRWETLGKLPDGAFWRVESGTYLRDITDLEALAVLDNNLRPVIQASRSEDQTHRLSAYLRDTVAREWLLHVVEEKAPHIGSARINSQDAADSVVLVLPLNILGQKPGLLLGVINVKRLFALLSQDLGGMGVRILEDGALTFESELKESDPKTVRLNQRQVALTSPHFDFSWQIEVFQTLNFTDLTAPAALPLWIYLMGLAGTLLLMLHQSQSLIYAQKTGELESSLHKQLVQQTYRQRIIDHSLDMLCTIDSDGRFIQVNPACQSMLGYSPDQIQGQNFLTLVIPEDKDRTQEQAEAIMGGRSTISFRNRYKHRDGRVVHLRWSAEWSPEEQTMYAIAHDISYQVKRERYEEDQRRVLAEISRGTALPRILESLCLMLEEQIVGARCSVMLADEAKKILRVGAAPHLPTEFLNEIRELEIAPDIGSCGAAAYQRQPIVITDIGSHPNWERLWVLSSRLNLVACWSVPVMADDGEVLGTLAVYHEQHFEPDSEQMDMVCTAAELAGLAVKRARDQSLILESEQRFRSLFQYNPDPVYSFDMEGRFESINEAGLTMTGYSLEEIVGQPCQSMVTEKFRPIVALHLTAALQGEPQRYTLQLHNRVGNLLTLDISYLPIIVNGQIQGVFGVAKDITERQRVAQDLRVALEHATRRAHQLQIMSKAAMGAARYTDQQSLLDYLVKQVRLSVGVHQSVISLTTEADLAVAVNGVSLSEKYAKSIAFAELPDASRIYEGVFKNNEAMLLTQEHLEAHPNFKRIRQHADTSSPIRGWLAVPLVDRAGRNLGILHLVDKIEGEFDDGDMAIAQQFAQMTVALVENIGLFEELEQAQNILRDQLALNRLITHTQREGLIAIDAAGQTTFMNPAARHIVSEMSLPQEQVRIDHQLPLPSFPNWPLLSAAQEEFQGFLKLRVDDEEEYAYAIRRMEGGWLLSLRDVTLERKMVRALQERDHFFNLSLEMFCLLDLDGIFVQVNPAFARTFGTPIEKLVGTPYLHFVEEEDRSDLGRAVRELRDGGMVRELALRVRNVQGKALRLQVSAALGSDDIIYCVAHDVTERFEAEEALRSTNLLLGIAGESARLGGWAATFNGEVTWSPELSTILEFPPNFVPSLTESLALYHEEDHSTVVTALEGVLREGRPAELHSVRIRTSTGRWLDVRVTGRPIFNEQGRVVKAIGSLQDITDWKFAQQESERLSARLFNTLESITDAFFMLDHNWQFSYVNREAGKVLHVARENLVGQSIWEAFPGSYDSEIGQHYRDVSETAESRHFESYYEPMTRWFEVHAYSTEEGIAVYFRDITTKKAAELELTSTLRELERSNRELQEFAYVASHDLQEPLRKIQTFSERISARSGQLDEEGQDYLRRMNSAAYRMQALIIDLLNYSRVGTKGENFQRVDMNQLFTDVLQDLETVLDESGAEVLVDSLPPLSGDASQLRQVIQNLLSNSLKFRSVAHPTRIRVLAEEHDAGGWTLIVEDNGIGFEEKYLDKIFAPFQRLHPRDAYPGTGIGLAIVKKIVERHGGTISACSQPGQGATFRIKFPKFGQEEGTA